jgi:hypothetical protein
MAFMPYHASTMDVKVMLGIVSAEVQIVERSRVMIFATALVTFYFVYRIPGQRWSLTVAWRKTPPDVLPNVLNASVPRRNSPWRM